jgi:hypothetical protein
MYSERGSHHSTIKTIPAFIEYHWQKISTLASKYFLRENPLQGTFALQGINDKNKHKKDSADYSSVGKFNASSVHL